MKRCDLIDSKFPLAMNVAGAVLLFAMCCPPAMAQSTTTNNVATQQSLTAAEIAVLECNTVTQTRLNEFERAWRNCFREARNKERLKAFVGETLDVFEKLQQAHYLAVDPQATEKRVGAMFRNRILDEETLCRSMAQSLAVYLRELDEQDQALFIKLKIDREVGRTALSHAVIDPMTFKQPLQTVVASAVTAVQNDMARSLAALVASEAISAVAKQAARDAVLISTEPGTLEDFLGGLILEIGVGLVVDAVTDPTPQMVSDLETRLSAAERIILDGQGNKPGFLTVLKQITQERQLARRKLVRN